MGDLNVRSWTSNDLLRAVFSAFPYKFHAFNGLFHAKSMINSISHLLRSRAHLFGGPANGQLHGLHLLKAPGLRLGFRGSCFVALRLISAFNRCAWPFQSFSTVHMRSSPLC